MHNSFATFHILRLLFSSGKIAYDVKASSLIQKEAPCFRFLKRYSEVLHDLSEGGGNICVTCFLVHINFKVQSMEVRTNVT